MCNAQDAAPRQELHAELIVECDGFAEGATGLIVGIAEERGQYIYSVKMGAPNSYRIASIPAICANMLLVDIATGKRTLL